MVLSTPTHGIRAHPGSRAAGLPLHWRPGRCPWWLGKALSEYNISTSPLPGTVESMCKGTLSMLIARQPRPSIVQASEEVSPWLQGRRPASGCLLFKRQSPRIVLWANLAAGSSSGWRGPSFSLPQDFKAFTAFFSTLFLRASLPYLQLPLASALFPQ